MHWTVVTVIFDFNCFWSSSCFANSTNFESISLVSGGGGSGGRIAIISPALTFNGSYDVSGGYLSVVFCGWNKLWFSVWLNDTLRYKCVDHYVVSVVEFHLNCMCDMNFAMIYILFYCNIFLFITQVVSHSPHMIFWTSNRPVLARFI